MRKVMISIMALAVICFGFGVANAVMINEWVSNDLSTDDYQFIELCGDPGESLDGLTIVMVEGEGTGAGLIDYVFDLTGYSITASGLFVMGNANVLPDYQIDGGFLENGGNNILLVQGFNSTEGTDIDVDDDCVADFSIGTIVDGVGYGYGYGAADCITYYGIPDVGPDGTYDPAGGARCDHCDLIGGEWFMICINGTEPGPTGSECLEADGYYIGWATPGQTNDCSPVPTENNSWGGLKSQYR